MYQLFVPAVVPAATATEPVAGFGVIPAFVDESWVRLTLVRVAAAPLNLSLTRTFATAIPPVLGDVAASFTASIANGMTLMVTVAVSQLIRLARSQTFMRNSLRGLVGAWFVAAYFQIVRPRHTLANPISSFHNLIDAIFQ